MTIPPFVTEQIKIFLAEDIGSGDHTSLCCIAPEQLGKARLICKEAGILAGMALAAEVLRVVDDTLKVDVLKSDGATMRTGEILLTVHGSELSILKAERLLLNIIQRMSGIATYTQSIVKLIAHTSTKVLDTRKTTPGFRYFEKEAVRIGGGVNHRYALYDMILLKDNHIDYAGGITNALTKAKAYVKSHNLDLKIEVEVRNFEELDQALACGIAFRIMLDNFTPENLQKAVAIIGTQAETEASGGINAQNIVLFAETGVNYISIGALTHQVKSLDLSLKAY